LKTFWNAIVKVLTVVLLKIRSFRDAALHLLIRVPKDSKDHSANYRVNKKSLCT
jgi:hypothetical protein